MKKNVTDLRTMSASDLRPFRNQVVIQENLEKLVHLPEELFRVDPHPYQLAGAPYGENSPFWVRESVATRLLEAQSALIDMHSGYRLMVWDAFRPLDVQDYMVKDSIRELAKERELDPSDLSSSVEEELRSEVHKIWAPANRDPSMPPPHSTGGAIDLTIVDESKAPIDMGSDIDCLPPLCLPNYFEEKSDSLSQSRHRNRELLNKVMEIGGFRRLPYEWWHFSFGDQTWAFIESFYTGTDHVAIYGSASVA